MELRTLSKLLLSDLYVYKSLDIEMTRVINYLPRSKCKFAIVTHAHTEEENNTTKYIQPVHNCTLKRTAIIVVEVGGTKKYLHLDLLISK